jgi:hypothetical protein
MQSNHPNATVTCPRDGSRWYACNSGSRFVGCCKLDPCRYGCDRDYVGAARFQKGIDGQVPDATCHEGSFYMCSNPSPSIASYWGCCKSNPCSTSGCPVEDVGQAYLDGPEQQSFYSNVYEQSPWANTSDTWVDLPTPASTRYTSKVPGPSKDLVLTGLCAALFVVLPVTIAIWISFRNLKSRASKKRRNNEMYVSSQAIHALTDTLDSVLLPAAQVELKSDTAVIARDITAKAPSRLGLKTLYVLIGSSLTNIGVFGFLGFLWFSNETSMTWKNIMTGGWATRVVTVSALVLRTAVDFQAAMATAMLVALLLESRAGVRLNHLANMSPMRTGTVGPWTLAGFMMREVWHSARRYKRILNWTVLALVLLITTILLQFSSTLLLSDIKPGLLGSPEFEIQLKPGFSFRNIYQRITRDAAWTTNPPSYPTFGEYSEPASTANGIADTGLLLRTFLPWPAAATREIIRSYAGKALVLDARVSCQAPDITNLTASEHYAEIIGTVNATRQANMLQSIVASPFVCSVAGPNQYSICQLGRPLPSFIGSLKSQFENSTSYGTAFLVTKGTNSTTRSADGHRGEWLDITFTNQTNIGAAFSICFAPWDASMLNVSLTSASNRTEPALQWRGGFKATAVVNHLVPQQKHDVPRQILQMEKPHNFLGDVPPERERPLVQSDASGSSAAAYGSNTPLQENWSIFLTGEPLITLLNHFSRPPSRYTISADPALATIFEETMAATDSVAWAMSSLVTVLSATNYYSQFPAFDRVDNVTITFFGNVQYPRHTFGFMLMTWVLVAHYLVMSLIVVMFVSKTRLTLLGDAWSAFSQMAESSEVKHYIGERSVRTESTVIRELGEGRDANLRARIVRRGDVVEFAVE